MSVDSHSGRLHGSKMAPTRGWPFAAHLALLCSLLIIPILLLSIIALLSHAGTERNAAKQEMLGTAQAFAADIDRFLASAVATLTTLSHAPQLDQEDLAGFHRFAAAAMNDDRSVIVRDAAGQQILNTRLPYGTALPASQMPSADRDRLATGVYHVSDLYVGATRREQVFVVSIALPKSGSRARYLSLSISPIAIGQLFVDQPMPQGWSAFVADRAGTVVATTLPRGEIVGPALREAIHQRAGATTDVMTASGPALMATVRPAMGEWQVGVWAPTARLEASSRRSWELLGLASLGLVVLSAGLALAYGRLLARPLSQIAQQARSLQHGEVIAPLPPFIREAGEAQAALAQSSARLKARTDELAASEERYRTIARIAPIIIFRTDAQAIPNYINERITAYTGRTPESLMGPTWASVVHPDDIARVERERQSAIEDKRGMQAELRLVHIDGRVFDVQMEAEPDLDTDGSLRGFAGYLIDITDRKNAAAIIAKTNTALEAQVAERTRALSETARELRTEMQRREAMQVELERSRKLEALGELTSGVAHEFNNVLMAISGNLQILQMRNPPPEMERSIENGLAAAKRASRLTEQLLSFTRQINLRPQTLALDSFLAGCEDDLRQAAGPQVEVAVDVPPDLSDVLIDEDQLLSALVNLVLNARDASQPGARITVSARAIAPGAVGLPQHLAARGAIALSVRDQGTGMAPDVLARATDPFFTTKSAGRGTGLGLAMVQAFAEQSGGSLRIDSVPDQGTVVSLWLPPAAIDQGVASPRLLASDRDASMAPERLLHKHVLYVDDDYLARSAIADMLRECGAKVTEADGALAAVRAMEGAIRFDLVIADIDMPGTNGLEFADELVARGDGPPVLLVTGHGLPATRHSVLPKPFSSSELVSHATAVLAAKKAW